MKIRGIAVMVDCDYCKGKRRIPGGRYRKEYGEVIDCPCCDGRGYTSQFVEWGKFITALRAELR